MFERARLLPCSTIACIGLMTLAPNALAIDSFSALTYYETVEAATPEAFASSASELPNSLHLDQSTARIEYQVLREDSSGDEWEVRVLGVERRHERVDAVYQLILALPLPAASDGRDGFTALQWGITPQEGDEEKSVPLIYGGEKVVLKRNVGLEHSLLAGILSSDGRKDALPPLFGTGYAYTLWDTILRYDPGHEDTVKAWASFRYRAPAGVAAPPSGTSAFLIVWIPSLDPSVAPFAVQIPVAEPQGAP